MSEALNEGNLVTRSAPRSGALVIRWHGCDPVDIAGELDCATAPMLEVALQPMLERGGVVGIGVGDLVFTDAAGLNVLQRAAQTLGQRGRIVLHRPRPNIERLISIVALHPLIDVEGGPGVWRSLP